jgi:hypothetical protein
MEGKSGGKSGIKSCTKVGSPARAAPGSRRNFWQFAPLAGDIGATDGRGRAPVSTNGDAAYHAVPIVVAAA